MRDSFVTTFIYHDTFLEGEHIQIGCDAALCVWKGKRIVGGVRGGQKATCIILVFIFWKKDWIIFCKI